MAICKFYQQGRCKFGDNCKFEHPGAKPQALNNNRFAVFQSPGSNASSSPAKSPFPGRSTSAQQDIPYHLHPDVIKYDLTEDRPQWPCSAYGPGRNAPVQLFGGDELERSPEELRVLHYLALAAGNPQYSIKQEQELYQKAQGQIRNVLSDVDGAIKYIIDGAHTHPNRHDICSNPTKGQHQAAFGQLSLVNPAFGHYSTSGSAFQQPPFSSFRGEKPLVPFRQASPFTQQSVAGAHSFRPGNAPFASQGPTYGQNSVFSQASASANTTGQDQPLPRGGFSGFGAPSSAFSAPSTFPMGDKPVNTTTASQANVPSVNGVFGGSTAPFVHDGGSLREKTNNPFSTAIGAEPSSTSYMSAFEQRGSGQQSSAAAMTARTDSSANLVVPAGRDINEYSTRDPVTQRLLSWKGKSVSYINNQPCYRRDEDGQMQRIWFPNGPPPNNPYIEMPESAYNQSEEEAYLFLSVQGSFKDGVMPEVGPRRQWIRLDV